jgi:murein DD-endopeptidase MepM/ murein hydrolase activator NlpD
MPGNRPTGRAPGPPDNLPRPPRERGRRGRGRRGLGVAAIAIVMIAIGGGVGSTLANGPLAAVGAVAGAVATPGPSMQAAGFVAQATEAASQPSQTDEPTPTPTPTTTRTPDPTPVPPAELTGYRSPLPHGRLTLPFGPSPWGSREVGGQSFHDGIDLATFCGDRVLAAHDGTVLAASRKFDTYMGWVGDLRPYLHRLDRKHLWMTLPIVVVIDDGNGYRSIYAHFGKVVVKKGQTVAAGDLLGYEGMTGRASGCHVHYGLFSPLERSTFRIEPAVVKRMLVPPRQIARIDPALVLPRYASRVPAPSASPTPSPTPPPSPSASPAPS